MGQKSNFVHGSREIPQFYDWMTERHAIYLRRRNNKGPPWTTDSIMQRYKFCNVFRQLDRGTVTLRNMIPQKSPDWLRIWNVVWYRLFNWRGNAAWFEDIQDLHTHITRRWVNDEILFTDAHMVTGREGELKHESILSTCEDVFQAAPKLYEVCISCRSMEEAFGWFTPFYGIGPFVAYEIVCDLRFIMKLFLPADMNTWANIGPGAKRGMLRLGLNPSVETMTDLLGNFDSTQLECEWPFELREIEHSLCEFDKYCRIDEGGTKRMRRFRG